jgi:hypothetical protein
MLLLLNTLHFFNNFRRSSSISPGSYCSLRNPLFWFRYLF